jgi:hypothetical protein
MKAVDFSIIHPPRHTSLVGSAVVISRSPGLGSWRLIPSRINPVVLALVSLKKCVNLKLLYQTLPLQWRDRLGF